MQYTYINKKSVYKRRSKDILRSKNDTSFVNFFLIRINLTFIQNKSLKDQNWIFKNNDFRMGWNSWAYNPTDLFSTSVSESFALMTSVDSWYDYEYDVW